MLKEKMSRKQSKSKLFSKMLNMHIDGLTDERSVRQRMSLQ